MGSMGGEEELLLNVSGVSVWEDKRFLEMVA